MKSILTKLIKILLLISAAIMFFWVFRIFFGILRFPDSEIAFDKGKLLKLKPDTSLTQKFYANRDGLMRLEFLVRTPGIQEGDAVILDLAGEDCEKTISEEPLIPSISHLDNNLYEAQFPVIKDSKNKTYCAKITFKPGTYNGNDIRFFSVENSDSRFIFTDAYGKINPSVSLAIRPVYENAHWLQSLDELNQRVSQYKPWFLKHYYLNSIVILFVLLSITVVAILILI